MRTPPATGIWRAGNRVALLENGEEYFERAFAAIAEARQEVLLETFILFEDKVGLELQRRLVRAARRGVNVQVLVDGYGSPGFSEPFLTELDNAGVTLRVFDPHRPLLGMRMHIFRRMHRKLLVVDAQTAFVGGINYGADHLHDFGPTSKQDYAVELQGPVVADIHAFAAASLRNGYGPLRPSPDVAASARGQATVSFAVRDNDRHTTDIERAYREAIRAARQEIVLANAYFFPGYGFLRDLRHAARRGVRVTLLVQGQPDMPIAMSAARSLYRHLVADGIRIFEYGQRAFHGKVALVDQDWATVGSSNLDPLSLSLNLEANVFIRDAAFNQDLRQRLERLRERHCRPIDPECLPAPGGLRLPAPVLYHMLRRFPAWAGLLPAHTPKVVLMAPANGDAADSPVAEP
ncbi:cardiolipin synthase ClsB [Pseudoxanthomonas wuyuanensis]|uniref:Cardiolipin synthase B n=1 Tax=Pseudoxanthomonas wuyuanensis TaxID=1073196 RepID=A0A286CY38_9GAMM|nr:cardiolipin synthase ClsB [Pseudoxanthomonas wuyuanensis]SOD51305.1 cardiolipin synthase [Pseudoxanthomonas wuyuanensis]